MLIRGLAASLNASGRYKYRPPESVVDHLIIGGGVVGLAIAEKLCKMFPDKSTYLVERHSRAGEETSSRNSEVIHAGIYYPPESLKTRLCIQGRRLLYNRCAEQNIPFRKIGKLVVAGHNQRAYLDKLIDRMRLLGSDSNGTLIPLKLISGEEAREMEPDLSREIESAIYSPETGIVDSHALMESFEKAIGESEAGDIVYATKVVRVDPYNSTTSLGQISDGTSSGWVVQMLTSRGDGAESSGTGTDALLAKTLINASGLNGNLVLNSLLPKDQAIPMYYARGSYATYRGPGVDSVSRLIYPVPELTTSQHVDSDPSNFQSLGTHLTLDLAGNIRFGPDIEWLMPPSTDTHEGYIADDTAIDFWAKHLVADENPDRLEAMYRAITTYLPHINLEGLKPDYVGIRPKLVGPRGGFQDFEVRLDSTETFGGSGNSLMVTLLGIESPGLTASLAIADYVVDRIGEIQGRTQ
ncbi:hypothetical protein M422DRAFT_62745 [Sphaerobolus stellatus SS14]|nr:hypothetical protein M422DRAFT_62745 [Sphaerobolus stellatus SS14]